jgi:PAS domain S-box-containing protein
LIGLFSYLNRYTRRSYFSVWTVAWLFYALWLVLCLALGGRNGVWWLILLKDWCVGIAAAFLLYGSARFLRLRTPQRLFGLFIGFLAAWAYVGIFMLEDALLAQVPVFGLMGLASAVAGWCFWRLRRRRFYIGAGLVATGFVLWGVYLGSYPFLQASEHLVSAGFFMSAVLQLFIAVSMIILVLEEARRVQTSTVERLEDQRGQAERFKAKAQNSEQCYRGLFERAAEGILIVEDQNLEILECNPAARRLLGGNGNGLSGMSLAGFIRTEGEAAAWLKRLEDWPRLKIVRGDGREVLVEVGGALVDFGGRPAYQLFVRDMTERTQLEARLRQSEKLAVLGRLVSGVAHGLNNPLVVIRGYVESLLSGGQLDPKCRADLEKVARESQRAGRMVNDFLSFARQRGGRKELVNLNSLVCRVVDLRKVELAQAGVELKLELEAQVPPEVIGDGDQLQEVLDNVVSNAIQELEEVAGPRRLLIRTQTSERKVRVEVQDTGRGVAGELAGRIFEPFFSTKGPAKGTGLGLSIAHSVMMQHRGRISHQRPEEGGARFVLELPGCRAEASPRDQP